MWERFKCFNVNFRLLKTIYVHLLVCCLNRDCFSPVPPVRFRNYEFKIQHVARMGEERGVYRVLVGKPEGKRRLGRPRHRWVDNIMMDLQEVGYEYMDWIGLAQDRDIWRTLVSAVMNLRVS